MKSEVIQRLTAHNVPVASLPNLFGDSSEKWLYAERPADTVLQSLEIALAEPVPWSAWQHGRVFSEDSELAWWREADGTLTCRLLTKGARPEGVSWDSQAEYTAVMDEDEQTLLHGEWDQDSVEPYSWSEARIPRYLQYPIDPKINPTSDTRVVLTVRRYTGPEGDSVIRLLAVATISAVQEQEAGKDAG